jgi:hypothetical protein
VSPDVGCSKVRVAVLGAAIFYIFMLLDVVVVLRVGTDGINAP